MTTNTTRLLTASAALCMLLSSCAVSRSAYTHISGFPEEKTADYSYDSIGTVALFSSNSDGLYFLKLSDDETQPHTLQKLIL